MKRVVCLLLALIASPAFGQDFEDPVEDIGMDESLDGLGAGVFVSPFQPRNAAAAGLAGMMSSFLEMELSRHPDLSVIPFSSVPPVHDMSAQLYLESCPPGKSVGCAYVVGSSAGAEYAVTGTVLAEAASTRVEVAIIDIGASQEAMSFVAQLEVGEDERFASGVAAVLVAVVRGEAGQVADIRDMSVESGPDYTAAATQLEALSAEMGMVRTQATRTGRMIDAPKMTVDDISQRMQQEGVKPWERVNLTPNQYMRWKNSGLPLDTFKERNAGRQKQVMLRPGLGFGRGPVNGRYNGGYVIDSGTKNIEEIYAWQSQESGSGLIADLGLGYGITPQLELGAQIGFASGRFWVLLEQIPKNAAKQAPASEVQYPNGNVFMGPYVLASFLPQRAFRPIVAGSVLLWRGDGVADKEVFPYEQIPTFTKPELWIAQMRVGGELRMSKKVDFYAHVPVTAMVAGVDTMQRHTGKGCRDDNGDRCMDTTSQPPGVDAVGAGFMIGLQVRLFGPRFSED